MASCSRARATAVLPLHLAAPDFLGSAANELHLPISYGRRRRRAHGRGPDGRAVPAGGRRCHHPARIPVEDLLPVPGRPGGAPRGGDRKIPRAASGTPAASPAGPPSQAPGSPLSRSTCRRSLRRGAPLPSDPAVTLWCHDSAATRRPARMSSVQVPRSAVRPLAVVDELQIDVEVGGLEESDALPAGRRGSWTARAARRPGSATSRPWAPRRG